MVALANENRENHEIKLSEIWRFLLQWWKLLLVGALIGGGAAGANKAFHPLYTSERVFEAVEDAPGSLSDPLLINSALAIAFSSWEGSARFSTKWISRLEEEAKVPGPPGEGAVRGLAYLRRNFGGSGAIQELTRYLSGNLVAELRSGRQTVNRRLFFFVGARNPEAWSIYFNTSESNVAAVYFRTVTLTFNDMVREFNQKEQKKKVDAQHSFFEEEKIALEHSMAEESETVVSSSVERIQLMKEVFKLQFDLSALGKDMDRISTPPEGSAPLLSSQHLPKVFLQANSEHIVDYYFESAKFESLMQRLTWLVEKGAVSESKINSFEGRFLNLRNRFNALCIKDFSSEIFVAAKRHLGDTYGKAITPPDRSKFALRSILDTQGDEGSATLEQKDNLVVAYSVVGVILGSFFATLIGLVINTWRRLRS